ncbi:hypothetical protein BLA29_013030 [Euroglyphus maynei]|uniref:Urocanase N-terminal domain-containing protein n=1 Tax=Euroglyphus maynei TaxID=6958 RepID=A0A1Y3AWS3_EURMA|nr:hypothetical protein BLA29_013030 [Euroglyphus maynei]
MNPSLLECLRNGIPIDPLPDYNGKRDEHVVHAPNRLHDLNNDNDKQLAINNALRYFPKHLHSILFNEFLDEFNQYGHIYMYRFIPKFTIKAYPIDIYPAKCQEAAAIMLMIMNNLDKDVAQFPHELVCYGGNGQVFSNWYVFFPFSWK